MTQQTRRLTAAQLNHLTALATADGELDEIYISSKNAALLSVPVLTRRVVQKLIEQELVDVIPQCPNCRDIAGKLTIDNGRIIEDRREPCKRPTLNPFTGEEGRCALHRLRLTRDGWIALGEGRYFPVAQPPAGSTEDDVRVAYMQLLDTAAAYLDVTGWTLERGDFRTLRGGWFVRGQDLRATYLGHDADDAVDSLHRFARWVARNANKHQIHAL